PAVMPGGRTMEPADCTVTLAVAFGMFAAAAVMVVLPGATDVTGTFTLGAPALNGTLPGTGAGPVLLEPRLTVIPPAGAGPERLSAKFCVVMPEMVRLRGANTIDALTVTGALASVKPGAVAVMVADPTLTPVTCGCESGVVLPPANVIVPGEIVTL